MKRNKMLIRLFFCVIALLFCFWFFYLKDAKERRLMNEGGLILERIEKYRNKTGRLPNSLIDIGIQEDEKTEFEISYKKKDSVNFVIWLGISADESKFYYSDTKKWESSFRW